MSQYEPIYLKTYQTGLLKEKIRQAFEIMSSCEICPRRCGVNRNEGETGICKTGKFAWVSSYNPHYGEESPLVGKHGSGTIFFTHCNLLCIFCQNYDISHEGCGSEVTHEQLANIMIHLQEMGCHNINFVTPTHVVGPILAALEIAIQKGLRLPLVYNTGAYDTVETIKLLDGVIDIYMPDFKFWDPEVAEKTCHAKDYPEIARNALKEMHRQVGDLVIDDHGIAQRGLLIRHLVLPHGLAGTREIMRFIAQELSPETYVNIMPQYRPCGRASEVKELMDYPKKSDFDAAFKEAKEEGIKRFDVRRRIFMVC